MRVWRAADDHERIYVSARAEGGSWADLGTLPVDFDQTTANGRFDYRDFDLDAPLSVSPAYNRAITALAAVRAERDSAIRERDGLKRQLARVITERDQAYADLAAARSRPTPTPTPTPSPTATPEPTPTPAPKVVSCSDILEIQRKLNATVRYGINPYAMRPLERAMRVYFWGSRDQSGHGYTDRDGRFHRHFHRELGCSDYQFAPKWTCSELAQAFDDTRHAPLDWNTVGRGGITLSDYHSAREYAQSAIYNGVGCSEQPWTPTPPPTPTPTPTLTPTLPPDGVTQAALDYWGVNWLGLVVRALNHDWRATNSGNFPHDINARYDSHDARISRPSSSTYNLYEHFIDSDVVRVDGVYRDVVGEREQCALRALAIERVEIALWPLVFGGRPYIVSAPVRERYIALYHAYRFASDIAYNAMERVNPLPSPVAHFTGSDAHAAALAFCPAR